VILLLRQNFAEIITGVVFIRFVFHLMTAVAFFRIRRRDTGAAGAWRMPGYPWLPVIFAIAAIGFIAYRFVYQTDQLVLDLLLMLPVLALTIYHFRRARQIE
jgi:amino acid transporter